LGVAARTGLCSQTEGGKMSDAGVANGLAMAACTAARRLCKVAHDVHQNREAEVLAAEVDSLEGLLNNHLHNLMLRTPSI
jgi:hypothetical protein